MLEGDTKKEYQRKYMAQKRGFGYSSSLYMKPCRLAWWRGETRDPYEPRYYTAITCSVYSPTIDRPWASVLISIANAGGRVLMRVHSIESALQVIHIPQEAIERLTEALGRANEIADQIAEDRRLAEQRRRLPEGVQWVRSDTGEIISETTGVYSANKSARVTYA